MSALAVLRAFGKLDDDAIGIANEGDLVQHLGVDGEARPLLDLDARLFKAGEGLVDTVEMKGEVADA